MTDQLPAHGPEVPCSACEVGAASFLLPSGAPVCADCFMALGAPEIRHLTSKERT